MERVGVSLIGGGHNGVLNVTGISKRGLVCEYCP